MFKTISHKNFGTFEYHIAKDSTTNSFIKGISKNTVTSLVKKGCFTQRKDRELGLVYEVNEDFSDFLHTLKE